MKNLTTVLLLAGALGLGGCAIGHLVGGMAQNYEYTKLIEVHPVYDGLDNKRVAVLVDLDMSTLYQHPDVAVMISANVARRLQNNVPGISILSPSHITEWQFRTPSWSTMPYGELCERLDVERIVRVDIQEFRLNPEGNQWLWDGVCSAMIGIVEREGFDPDGYVEMFTVDVAYPDLQGVTRENADARAIQTGLLALFVRETSWLFFRHLEPKYPEHYDGPIKEGRYDPDAV